MTFEDAKTRLDKLITDLNALAEDAVENDNSDEYLKNITMKDALVEYLEKDLKGDPPVNLEELGYGDVLDLLKEKDQQTAEIKSEHEIESASLDPTEAIEEKQATPETNEEVTKESKSPPVQEVIEEPDKPEDNIDHQQVEKLIADALDASGNKDYYTAVMNLERVLELDPNYREAEKLLREATDLLASQKIAESIKSITDKLRNATDIQILNDAVNDAESLIKEDKGTRDLEEALLEGRNRFDEIRRIQGQGTTAEALNQYDEVIISIQAIEESILKGDVTWYDARVDAPRPINDVLGEMRSNLPQLALDVSRRKVNRAEAQMPHHPKTALEYYKEAVDLDGLDPEPREAYEIEYEKLQKEFKKWEQADSSLIQAEKTQNPVERIKLAYKAKSQYPDHAEIDARISLYGEQAVRHLETRFGRAFKDVDLILASEEEEAIKQVNQKGTEDLKVFKDALDRIDEVKKELSQVEYKSPELTNILKNVEEKENLVLERSKRRGKIQQLYYRINNELQGGNIKSAKSIYTKAPSEFQYDPVIAALDRQLEDHWGIDEIIPQVERLLSDQQWQLVLDKLPDSLKAEGALGQRLDRFRINAEIGLAKANIHEAWIQEDYIVADSSIRVLSNIIKRGVEKKLIPATRRQEILDELNFKEKNAELNRRQEFDDQVERAITELEPKLKKPLCFDAYDELVKLEKIESNFVGQIRERINTIREKLYKEGIKNLQEKKKKKTPNYTEAFNVANELNNRDLILETTDRDLRLWAIKGYYEQEHILLRESGNWDKIVRNWESAVKEFKYVADLRTRLREIRMECLIENVDKVLKEMDHTQAISYLEKPESICVNDSSLPFEVDLRENDDLRTRYLSAKALAETRNLFLTGQYEVMVERLENLEGELGRKELRYQREELTEQAVRMLISTGDEFVQSAEGDKEQNLPKGIEYFSRALGLKPDDILAQQRIRELSTEVQTEIEQTIDEFKDYSISLEDVQDQLQNARYNDQKISNFIGIIHLLVDSPDRYKNALKQAHTRVGEILSDIERARKIIVKYEPDHSEWRSILRRGNWERVNQDVVSLKAILKSRHPQVQEIEQRVEITKQTRNEIQDAEQKFSIAFKEDDFEGCIKASNELLAILGRIQSEYATEPFGIVPENYSIFDRFSRVKIERVEKIIEVAENRRQDLKEWKSWYRKIDKRMRQIEKKQVELDDLIETYDPPNYRIIKGCLQHIEDVDQFLDLANNMPGDPSGQPDSRTSQALKDEVEVWIKNNEHTKEIALEEIEEETEMLQKLLPDFQDNGQEGTMVDYETMVDDVVVKLTDMINTYRFLEAVPVISTLKSYFQDEDDPLANYINHLSIVCENNS